MKLLSYASLMPFQVALFQDSDAIFTTEIWNPSSETWSVAASHQVPRTYHSIGLLLKTGEVLGGGGGLCGDCDTNHPDFEIFTPPYLFASDGSRATRPVIESVPPTFNPGDVISVTMDTDDTHTFALMRLGAATHAINNDMRRIPLEVVSSTGGVFELQTDPNPAIIPPGDYFLFAMNSLGVPSVAETVRAGNVAVSNLQVASTTVDGCTVFERSTAYYVISRSSGKGLNVFGVSREVGANVEQRTVGTTSGPSDQFIITPTDSGFSRLEAVHSRQVLTVEGGSKARGTSIVQGVAADAGANGEWCFVAVGGGFYHIRSRSTDLSMDVFGASSNEGDNIVQWPYNNQANQQWRLDAV